MKVIDLSHTIHEGMQIYPGDPVPTISRGLTHEENYCHVDTLQMGSHTGTHLDAPYHFVKEGQRIDTIAVAKFVGSGVLFDVSGKPANAMITPEDLKPVVAHFQKGDFAIFCTGWDRHFGTELYFQHPFIGAECAERLRRAGVTLVGIDAMSVDPSSDDAVSDDPAGKEQTGQEAYGYPAHDIMMGSDILIVENLCNLDRVPRVRGIYAFLPLKLKGSDGSPIRAVYMDP